MKTELSKIDLDKLVQANDISNVTGAQLKKWFSSEPGILDFAPEGLCQRDPRNGNMVVYNSARAKRPHDNKAPAEESIPQTKPCPICEGKSTGVVDVAPLSEGHTFINKNLFPCFTTQKQPPTGVFVSEDSLPKNSLPKNSLPKNNAPDPQGYHFLQWTSTVHRNDWYNMPVGDLQIVLNRLGALEKQLLFHSSDEMPPTDKWHGGQSTCGFTSIIKNFGAAVGGSLVHGHQQLTYSNVMSKSAYDNWLFNQNHGTTFSQYMQHRTTADLRIMDWGEASLITPYFMRRPSSSMLFVKNAQKQFIHELSPQEQTALAGGISQTLNAYHRLLPAIGREIAYNFLIHTGPGAGIYVEFLPFTQEMGGLEQLGLWVCQDNPVDSTARLRDFLGQ